MKGPL